MTDLCTLDNIMWEALSGAQRHCSSGNEHARRFARGYSPIAGFPVAERPDFAALREFCEPGEHFYVDRWEGEAPEGWSIDTESRMVKMVWAGVAPGEDAAPDAVPLGPQHAQEALALAQLTRPGPFGPRTIELGEYFGLFEDDVLVAMAGERMQAGSLREISGVCTLPSHQGRGLAGRLMRKLVARELRRGETPFLHVMRDNSIARLLYARMGFRDYLETGVRIVSVVR